MGVSGRAGSIRRPIRWPAVTDCPSSTLGTNTPGSPARSGKVRQQAQFTQATQQAIATPVGQVAAGFPAAADLGSQAKDAMAAGRRGQGARFVAAEGHAMRQAEGACQGGEAFVVGVVAGARGGR
ncbi:hypothetical protein G6F40_015508 [Rhizopus arrhizus]|nr:hypothetical protein G6F40_015508 [Rhizopus arrhizus]